MSSTFRNIYSFFTFRKNNNNQSCIFSFSITNEWLTSLQKTTLIFFIHIKCKKTTIFFSSTQQLFRRLKKIPLQTVHRSFWFGLSLFTTIHSLVCQTQSRAGGLVDSLGRFFSLLFLFFSPFFAIVDPLTILPLNHHFCWVLPLKSSLTLSLSLSLFFSFSLWSTRFLLFVCQLLVFEPFYHSTVMWMNRLQGQI